MKMINVTNSHSAFIKDRLATTAANMIKIYTLGKTTVVHSEYHDYAQLSISNESRGITDSEADYIIQRFKKKLSKDQYDFAKVAYKESPRLIEITIPKR